MRIQAAVLIVIAALPSLSRADEQPEPQGIRNAVERGLKLVQASAARYVQNRSCFSCHHQLAVPVLAAAKERGFSISESALRTQTEFTRDTFRPIRDRMQKGQGVPGANTMAAYALMVLESGQYRPDETTAAMIEFLLQRQKADGSWPAVADRPPSEGSSFTNAALALRALRTYGLNDGAFPEERRERVQAAWDRGRDWLRQAKPVTTEDKVFHLRACVEAGEKHGKLMEMRAALLRDQRDDGGWAQLPDLASDAYATGTALMALGRAGLPATDPAYRGGIAYLLKTQNEAGSWIVPTRSRPVQVFFDNGDPGGKAQFISMTATNWALLSLLHALPVRP